MATLDRYAKTWDPLAAAAGRAAKKFETVFDIFQKTTGAVKTQAFDMMTEAVDRLNTATRNLAMGFDVDKRIDELTAKFNPAQASVHAMWHELKELNDAQKLGIPIAGGYAAAQQQIIADYNEGAQAAAKMAEQQREMIETARAAQAAQSAPSPTTLLGLGGAPGAGSAQASAAVFQEAAEAQAALANETQRLTGLFKPATTAAEQYKAALQDVDAALSLEIIDAAEAAAQQTKLADAYAKGTATASGGLKNLTNSAFGARFAQQQLGVQTIQFFSSLEAGQPFVQAFIGQAHQVVDVAVATGTGFKVLAQGVGNFFASIGRWIAANPLVTALVATTAALAAMGAMAELTARRIEASRNILSGVRDDYIAASQAADQLAKSLAATTTLTTAQSRAASQTLFQGGFTGTLEQGQAIVKVFADLSKVLGETQPDWKRMGDAMRDPAGVMQTLLDQNHLKGLNQALVDNAKRMQEAGNFSGAAAELMKALVRETGGVTNNMTPLETALKKLEDAFTHAGQAGRSFADTIGTAMTNAAAAVINFYGLDDPVSSAVFRSPIGQGKHRDRGWQLHTLPFCGPAEAARRAWRSADCAEFGWCRGHHATDAWHGRGPRCESVHSDRERQGRVAIYPTACNPDAGFPRRRRAGHSASISDGPAWQRDVGRCDGLFREGCQRRHRQAANYNC